METKINDLILNKNSGGLSLKEQFESDICDLGEKIHNLGLNELVVRENEVKIFEESIEDAQKETQQKGVKTIEAFLKGESYLIFKIDLFVCLFVFMDTFFRRKLGIPNEI